MTVNLRVRVLPCDELKRIDALAVECVRSDAVTRRQIVLRRRLRSVFDALRRWCSAPAGEASRLGSEG
jgi:hypothetical protein